MCQTKAHQTLVPLLTFSASESGWPAAGWGSPARRAQAWGTAPLHRQQSSAARWRARSSIWQEMELPDVSNKFPSWVSPVPAHRWITSNCNTCWAGFPARWQECAQVLGGKVPDGPSSFEWLPVLWLRLAELELSSQNILVSTNQHPDGKAAVAKEVSVTEIRIQNYSSLWAGQDSWEVPSPQTVLLGRTSQRVCHSVGRDLTSSRPFTLGPFLLLHVCKDLDLHLYLHI